MFCGQCQTVTLTGEKCAHCGLPFKIFQKPEIQVDKKGDLYEKVRLVQNHQLNPTDFLEYLQAERSKIRRAGELAGELEPMAPLGQALDFWGRALEEVEVWLDTRNELKLATALALATQADEQLHRAVLADWEQTRKSVASQQWMLKLQGYQPPPPVTGPDPPAPESAETDWYPGPH